MLKNKKTALIIISLFIIFACFAVVGCDTNKEPITEEQKPISYTQTLFYTANNNEFRVKLIQGRGETLFVADGKQSGNEQFTTLTVTPLNKDQANNELSYRIVGENGETSGTLAYERLQAFFSASPDIQSIGKPLKIILQDKSREVEINLENLMEGKITADEAMQIAEDSLKDKLNADDKDREIYIRLINNSLDPDSNYYWYVAFIASPTDYYSALIDSSSGSILSTNP